MSDENSNNNRINANNNNIRSTKIKLGKKKSILENMQQGRHFMHVLFLMAIVIFASTSCNDKSSRFMHKFPHLLV